MCGTAIDKHPDAADTEVLGELQVRVTIADHHARREVYTAIAYPVIHQCSARLATTAAVLAGVGTDEHSVELQSLRSERFDHEGLWPLELVSGEGGGAEAVLVGHHDEPIA